MSRRRSPAALICGLLALSLVTAACGLKPEQRDALKQGTTGAQGGAPGVNGTTGGVNGGLGGTTGGTTGTALGTTGTTGGFSTTGGTTTGGFSTSGGGTTAGTTTGGGTTGSTTGLAAGGPRKPCDPPAGGNTTGITNSSITIGIHAPQTGTGAPLPPSFQAGASVYWKTHKICGRTVNVDFQDDKYTPQTARQVCEPMSRRDFFVIGAAGTDQIQACATERTIHEKNVPYLSAGVTDNGLGGLSNYFAVSLTFFHRLLPTVENALGPSPRKSSPSQ